jgi:drug/metabolite transporter (DMT)-like permease
MRLTGMRASLPRSPHLLLALVVVIWAAAFAAIKQLLHDGLTAPDIALGRYLIAAPGFVAVLIVTGGIPGLGRRDLARIVAAGLLVVVVYHLSLNAGERLTTAGTASVVVASAPGMTLAMALALGQERFSRRRALGLAVSFAGVVCVVLLGSGQRISFHDARGPLIVLAAPLAFAAYNVILKPLFARHGAIPLTAAAGLVGTVALLPFAGGGTLRRVSDLHAGGAALLLYLGLAATLGGYLGWTLGLRRLDASRASAYLYGVPVVAIVIGALTLGEQVTVWLGLGAALVVAGVAMAQ